MGESKVISRFESEAYRKLHTEHITRAHTAASANIAGGYGFPIPMLGRYDIAPNNISLAAANGCYYDGASGSVAIGSDGLYLPSSESAILGLRQQIDANVKTLVPYLKVKTDLTRGIGNNAVGNLNPQVNIVTIGQEPNVRACVFSGGAAMPKKLMHSDAAKDATGALSNLLSKTQSLLATTFSYASDSTTKVGTDLNSRVTSSASTFCGYELASAAPNCEAPGNAAPICEVPREASKSAVNNVKFQDESNKFSHTAVNNSKFKVESKAKQARTKTNTSLWGSTNINNASFLENCGDSNGNGGDSGFNSRDGEPHPNRSYIDLRQALCPPTLFPGYIAAPKVVPEVMEVSDMCF